MEYHQVGPYARVFNAFWHLDTQHFHGVNRGPYARVFNAFWHLDTQHFHGVNGDLMVLLPKTAKASSIKDYHPISLIHIVGKLFSKVFANNRLAPKLAELVHPC
jgi:hypothetical protein